MRLLKKPQIAAQVAEQRKMQIDEGLAIAKRVDALRVEVLTLQNKRNSLIQEIRELEIKWQSLQNKT